MDNDAQQAFWNGPAGEGWVTGQAGIDRSLEQLTVPLIEAAAPAAHERIVDVGCGCGTTSLKLAASGAGVWGVDISAPMIAYAKERAADLDNVSFSCQDAAAATFTPDHDLVFSRFGVMFFADPVTAFSNLRTALKPGGRLLFLCWQGAGENDWMRVPLTALKPYLEPTPAPEPRAPGPFAFGDRSYLEATLAAAGFSNIVISSEIAPFYMGADVADAVQGQVRNGPLARQLSQVPEAQRAQALAAIAAALEGHLGEAGVTLQGATWLVSATSDGPATA